MPRKWTAPVTALNPEAYLAEDNRIAIGHRRDGRDRLPIEPCARAAPEVLQPPLTVPVAQESVVFGDRRVVEVNGAIGGSPERGDEQQRQHIASDEPGGTAVHHQQPVAAQHRGQRAPTAQVPPDHVENDQEDGVEEEDQTEAQGQGEEGGAQHI